MPARMHSFYLRQDVPANDLLARPGRHRAAGRQIDLRRIKVPPISLSTLEDHIAPWKITYRATQIYSGPVRFVLAASRAISPVWSTRPTAASTAIG